ncbi:MAG: hypothetical protein EA416_07815 [Trueperaceae bacterium]|nr:MAG: hypothetical protein EA416_07815 [Trueperaceae bacterium]
MRSDRRELHRDVTVLEIEARPRQVPSAQGREQRAAHVHPLRQRPLRVTVDDPPSASASRIRV